MATQNTHLYALTLAEASTLLDRGEVSSIELTQAALDRIDQVQPTFHPFQLVTRERAQDDARRADAERARGQSRGPLHGIPIALKDIFNTAGIPTTSSSKHRQDFVPSEDCTVAERLRAAGTVLLGKTVTEEFAYGVISAPTRCAWDAERIPGGSSGGSGVAVALEAAMGAMGSDTGGSIRIPASLNGITGLKATFGRVPKWGVTPVSWTLDSVGPMTRTAEDCAMMLQVVAGYDPRDTTSSRRQVSDYTADLNKGLRGLRIGVPRGYLFEGVPPDIEGPVREAIQVLGRESAELIDVETPLVQYAVAANMTALVPEASLWHRQMVRTHPELYLDHVRIFIEMGEFYLATDYVQALKVRTLIKQAMREVYRVNNLDLMMTPTLTTTALKQSQVRDVPEEGEEKGTFGGYVQTTKPFNQTGQPAITVPCGFDSHGIPVGIQIVGRPFDEATVLRAAHGYQQVTDWHTRRPSV